jgi:hypothetical protein
VSRYIEVNRQLSRRDLAKILFFRDAENKNIVMGMAVPTLNSF